MGKIKGKKYVEMKPEELYDLTNFAVLDSFHRIIGVVNIKDLIKYIKNESN